MKSIIYFCLIFVLLMSGYYLFLNKDEKVQVVVYTDNETTNLADNNSNTVTKPVTTNVTNGNDNGSNDIVAKLQTDNSSEAVDVSKVIESTLKSATNNEDMMKILDGIIKSVSDNISKAVIMFAEYLSKNVLLEGNETTAKDNVSATN